jgi:phosphatidylglycerophosphatase A
MESPLPDQDPPSAAEIPPARRRWPFGTILLSWFGLGLVGRAPGTLGSAGCIPLAAIIVWTWGQRALFDGAFLVFVIGWILTAMYLRNAPAEKDPQWIVIDEVAAQWAVLAAVPLSFGWYLAGFVLFRIFDIAKPWPVSWADRNVPGALGIMIDDLLAGLYATIILITVRLLWLH